MMIAIHGIILPFFGISTPRETKTRCILSWYRVVSRLF
jgi:hypothetical protein